ncbi:MAG: purine-nucleoside phosphorylase [Bdellovibrionales bacterium]
MSTDELKRQLDDAVQFIRGLISVQPKLGITLGSGLSGFADQLQKAIKIPFAEIPHFAPPTVAGHGGHLVVGLLDSTPVAILQGRVHYYEGHDMAKVVFPTRVLAQLGVQVLLLTNASGGLDPLMRPGDFMILRDHINLTGANPLRGPNPDFLGLRFPDMSEPYDKNLRKLLHQSLDKAAARYSEGVYAGVAGPCYETAAEVRFLQIIGAQAVGMSTVAETIAARHCDMRVAALACITNQATGLSSGQITHDEVKDIAKLVEQKFSAALTDFTKRLSPELK